MADVKEKNPRIMVRWGNSGPRLCNTGGSCAMFSPEEPTNR